MNFCFFTGGGSFVAGRVSARRPSSFLLPRQKKRTKEKATRVRVSLRCAKGNLRCSRRAGNLQTRLSLQTCSLLIPPAAALLGTRTRERGETSPRFALGFDRRANNFYATATATATARTRTIGVSTLSGSPLHLRWCEAPAAAPVPPLPCGCAEQRSGARKKRDACLSPQGEFADRPRFASSAGCPVAQRRGRRHQGRLSFGDFSLAKQRKVPRPPGRDPACPASQHLTEKTQHA